MPAKFNRNGEEGSWVPDDTEDRYRDLLRSKVHVTERGCWEWRGGWINPWGYGTIRYRKRAWMVHRLSFVLWKGPIPKGHYICHTCDNPPCLNPDHLWAGKSRDNLKDCVAKGRHTQANQTHCKHGHPLSGDNVRVFKHGDGKWKRACVMCQRIHNRLKAGWPEELARSAPCGKPGQRPPEMGNDYRWTQKRSQ